MTKQVHDRKPVVLYSFVIEPITLHAPAVVKPINHGSPLVSNETLAITSPVEKIVNDHCFETKNTIYKEENYAKQEADRNRAVRPVRYY